MSINYCLGSCTGFSIVPPHCCALVSAGYGYLEGVESQGYLRGAQDTAEHN